MEKITLNMTPSACLTTCHASQYDIGRQIRFDLVNGADAFVLSGAETITLKIRRADGVLVENAVPNTSSNYVIWTSVAGECDAAGVSECELRVTDGADVLGSENFLMSVEADAYDGRTQVKSASGAIATFETNIVDLLQEVKCSINPIQNGTPWIDSNEVNKEPYIKRAVAGTASRIGNHLYDKLVGGTVAFNQLVQNGNFADSSGWNKIGDNASISVSNNELTFTGSNDAVVSVYRPVDAIKGHKLMYCIDIKGEDNYSNWLFTFGGAETYNLPITNTWVKYIKIVSKFSDSYNLNIIRKNESAVGEIVHVKNVQLIDLTAMFGSTIADYIYGLEQATAGAGVAWFKALFPNDYYAYNAGELMSVKATAHVMKNASNQVIGNYALDSNLELRGIPKLDANNKLFYDGDTYESNGSVTRRYGIVDLGSLDWTIENGHFYSNGYSMKIVSAGSMPNILCVKYISSSYINVVSDTTDKLIGISTTPRIYICDTAYNDAQALKTSLSGVYLIYEKETPTSESADPFTNPQICDENGTEEYTDSRAVPIPVGHETYQANICEIEGYTEANITRCGVNLWDEVRESGRINFDTGENSPLSGTRSKNYIPVKPNTTIYISSSENLYICCYSADKTFISYQGYRSNATFTTDSNTCYIRFYSVIADLSINISINYPSTDTTYHAYTGNTYTIAFGQTVYGGLLDVTRGKLKPCIEYPSYNGETLSGRWLSSEATYIEGTTPPTGSQVVSLDDYGSDIDLTPEVISAVVGENNVFADCGQSTVKYLKAGE